MAKRLIKGYVYPLVEDGSILVNKDNKVLEEADKGIFGGVAPLNSEGKVPNENLSVAFDGLTKITVGISQPDSPSVGDLWVDTS